MKIEIYHDILAKKVLEKVSGDKKMLRKIERLVNERYSFYEDKGRKKNGLLNQNDLDTIIPYLGELKVSKEAKGFIQRSRTVQRRSARLRMAAIGAVVLILGLLFLATASWIRAKAETQKAVAATVLADSLRLDADSLRADAELREKMATVLRDSAVMLGRLAEEQKILAEQNAGRATQAQKELVRINLAFIDKLIQITEEDIKLLEYEKALENLNSATDLGLRSAMGGSWREKAEKHYLEIIYYHTESGKFNAALEPAQKLLLINPTMALLADTIDQPRLQKRESIKKVLRRLKPAYFQMFEERYYPEMVPVLKGNSNFKIAKTETTLWQYNLFCHATDRSIESLERSVGSYGNDPVINVKFSDIIAYLDWINRQQGKSGEPYAIEKDKQRSGEEVILSVSFQNAAEDAYRLPLGMEGSVKSEGSLVSSILPLGTTELVQPLHTVYLEGIKWELPDSLAQSSFIPVNFCDTLVPVSDIGDFGFRLAVGPVIWSTQEHELLQSSGFGGLSTLNPLQLFFDHASPRRFTDYGQEYHRYMDSRKANKYEDDACEGLRSVSIEDFFNCVQNSFNRLQELKRFLMDLPVSVIKVRISMRGLTSKNGNSYVNKALSVRRVESVKRFLLAQDSDHFPLLEIVDIPTENRLLEASTGRVNLGDLHLKNCVSFMMQRRVDVVNIELITK